MMKRWKLLGQGNNGAVLKGPEPDTVLKWTIDPLETQMWLAVQSLRNEGQVVPGFPEIYEIWLDKRAALVLREDAKPGTSSRGLDPQVRAQLQRSAQLLTAGRIDRQPALIRRGRVLQKQALSTPLFRSLREGMEVIDEAFGIWPVDIRPENLARRLGQRDSILNIDPGRTPVETLAVAPGEACRRCPNETALARAVTEILGTAPTYGACKITNYAGLRAVMSKHGWADAEIGGTAGFHTEPHCSLLKGCTPGDILILDGNEWSTLHELVHAAGVIDKGMAPWLCEGITEATAQAIAKMRNISHHPTYPREVKAVTEIILPVMRIDIVQLAKKVIKSPSAAAKAVAQQFASRVGGTNASWLQLVGSSGEDVEKFIQRYHVYRSNTRLTERKRTAKIAQQEQELRQRLLRLGDHL